MEDRVNPFLDPTILHRAADILEAQPKLNQTGGFYARVYALDGSHYTHCYCIMGAVARALGAPTEFLGPLSTSPMGKDFFQIKALLTEALGPVIHNGPLITAGKAGDIYEWNDYICKDKHEAAALLRKVAQS